jgi:uncharacterized membrane protein
MEARMDVQQSLKALLFAGFLLGVGLGGFFDGIFFHQILQSHSTLSGVRAQDTVPGMRDDRFWEGIFYAFNWASIALGVRFLWTVARRGPQVALSSRVLIGSMLLGWGAFIVVEGVLAHYVFGLHHVVERLGLSLFDFLFLGYGVALGAIGTLLVREGVGGRSRSLRLSHSV